uniref:Chemokine interleukin-8-like domain-containing protein n=1 Tax=Cyprinus carpio TaxID=7962 RepID=A0A8C2I6S6_CYPCA
FVYLYCVLFACVCFKYIVNLAFVPGYPPPSCCVTVEETIPRRILRLVSRCEIQRRYGACRNDALILHIRNRPICAHPKLLKKLKKIHQSQTGLNDKQVMNE